MTILDVRLPATRGSERHSGRSVALRGRRVGLRGHTVRLRVGRFLLLPALVLFVAGLVALELRTFRAQAFLLSTFARELDVTVGEGASRTIELRRAGPYDERLGYSRMPEALERLEADGWRVAAQARLAPRHERLVRFGMAPIYREKTQAGLEILDPAGARLYSVRYPQRIYSDFDEVPPLVARTLLFIENRELLDPLHPFRNPAIEWDRFANAIWSRGLRVVNPGFKGHGGSTLATQLEKSRHSPGGRTPSGTEKLRQMATASLRAYREGPITETARRRTLVEYLNALPLAAQPGWGEVHGLGDGLWAWYGSDLADTNRLLATVDRGNADPQAAIAYRQVLSLLLAQRRPAYYLVEDPAALDRLTDRYLTMLHEARLVPSGLVRRGLSVPRRTGAPARERTPLHARKADLAVRTNVASVLGVDRLYDLDRYDLTVSTTLDSAAQRAVTDALFRLSDPQGARKAGIAPLLGGGDPAGVLYSYTLYERTAGGNAVRVQADSQDQPLDLNAGAKLEMGSTAKLRTLVTYLELIAELHDRHAGLPLAERAKLRDEAPDGLTRWVLDFLTTSADTTLDALLEAAMLREYSATPWEGFFTGGGLHYFQNFDKADNGRRLSVRQAFHRSVNLVFIRMMRDVVEHYRVRVPGSAASILDDPEHPLRRAYLERFADREGADFLRRYYREYRGTGPEAALQAVVADTRPIPSRLAAVHRSTRPDASFEEFERFLRSTLPHAVIEERVARRWYEELAPERLSLADRGYVARVHPLELWLVEYLARQPDASLADVLESSAEARQEVYSWLHNTAHKHAQDRRIRTLLEVEAFVEIHRLWQRLGYPFDSLVPSYATAIGSSADRPAALAELLGILSNDGVRRPTQRLSRLHFGAGTPFETVLERAPDQGERVLHSRVAALARQELLGVVRGGTATRARKQVVLADGSKLDVGGKTGTGDNRQKRNGVAAKRAGVLNRTASFVFVIGDRFYGTVLVYVPGEAAADYGFTSSAAVQVFNHLLPAIEPVLARPASIEEWSLFDAPADAAPARPARPSQIAGASPAPLAPAAVKALRGRAGPIQLDRRPPRTTIVATWPLERDPSWRRSCRDCGPGGSQPATVAVLNGSTVRIYAVRRSKRRSGKDGDQRGGATARSAATPPSSGAGRLPDGARRAADARAPP